MRITFAARLLFAVSAAFAVGCAAPSETIWSSKTSPSPDGRWVVQEKELAWGRGLFSDYGRVVEIRRASDTSGQTLLMLDGDWRSGNAEQAVRLRWASERVIEIIVPNLTEYSRTLAEYEGIQVRVAFRYDNPSERRAWLRRRQEKAAWAARQ